MMAAAVLVSIALAAQAEPQPSPSPSPSPWPSVFPVPSPSPRPVADSIDRVVARIEAEKNDPCFDAKKEGVPCFPVRTDMNGPTASVREGLGLPGPQEKDKPTPDRPPTRDEMGPYRANPITPSLADVTFDPGCVGKSLLKGLRGKNDTYYLYRLRDTAGERVVLYDHRIDATKFQGEVAFLGEFKGECAAISAYERERRRIGTP